MANRYFQRPENALKRAKELSAVGSPKDALKTLHMFLKSRKQRQWKPAHEDIIQTFIDLCVELKDAWRAKDGLFHYRNIAQQQSPGSIETAVKHLIDRAMAKLDEVVAEGGSGGSGGGGGGGGGAEETKAESKGDLDLAAITDLEAEESPETLLMKVVTMDAAVEKTSREKLIPLVRFMWAVFRDSLDTLSKTPQMEGTYHTTCVSAFQFCIRFKRKTEFHRLCKSLHNHLKRQLDNSKGEPWPRDIMESHLRTRFEQLETCTQLGAWNEALWPMKDVATIIEKSAVAPRPVLVATYFEKLSRVFWVLGNYLFHAYTWNKHFTTTLRNNTSLSEAQKAHYASAVVMAALCIPVFSSSGELDASVARDRKMGALIMFNFLPTRKAIMEEIRTSGTLDMALPSVRSLFEAIEVKFHPLDLVPQVAEAITALKSVDNVEGGPDLAQYVQQIKMVAVYRSVEQLSKVYHSIRIDFFQTLIRPLGLSFADVEMLIVRAVKRRNLHARIDHQSASIQLGEDHLETDAMPHQLTTLANALKAVIDRISPPETAIIHSTDRREAFEAARVAGSHVHDDLVKRQAYIEKKREEAERAREARLLEEEMWRKQQKEAAMEEARIRRQEEAKKLEDSKRKKLLDAKKVNDVKTLLAAVGTDAEKISTDELAKMDRSALEKKAQDMKRKKWNEAARKLKYQAKRLDYVTRALREREVESLQDRQREREAERKRHYDDFHKARLDKLRKQHAEDVAKKAPVARMQRYLEPYLDQLIERRQEFAHAERTRLVAEAHAKWTEARLERARERKAMG